jgi:hypothetical protein
MATYRLSRRSTNFWGICAESACNESNTQVHYSFSFSSDLVQQPHLTLYLREKRDARFHAVV